MTTSNISGGTAHTLPADLKAELIARKAEAAWESLTPLARNEWICWCVSVKQDITRKQHIARVPVDLKKGKRRPCCWIGCIHRKDKEISPSIKGILAKQAKRAR